MARTNRNTGKIQPKKGTLKYSGSGTVAIDKSVTIAVYMTNRAESEQAHFEDDPSKHSFATVCHRVIIPTNKLYLH